MCPICMTTIAATVAGLGSAGGITAFFAAKLRSGTSELRSVEDEAHHAPFKPVRREDGASDAWSSGRLDAS